ncbi:hypothetical protein JD844_025903 [Phrynosoma platyrhinos]|uniref:Dystrobrevin beta n=1 Tax=Phrynosoma platyrhinos TaxID=52577 RepID=A0ABQ7SZX5_PHRPL|nr:hypothetical protein JD844_025903 [Phrynosoma platyrhinos]
MPMPVRSTSAGSTPTHGPQDSLAGVGGDVQEAFAQGSRRNLRNDLLVAADSITNTMSSLVKELHSGSSWSSGSAAGNPPSVLLPGAELGSNPPRLPPWA